MFTKFNYFILIFSTNYLLIFADNNCNNVFSIIQKIENEGFHREFKWLIETQESLNDAQNECNFTLRIHISPAMFVNRDQIADINESGKRILVEGEFDIEIAAHEAKNQVVYIFLNHTNNGKISVSVPVHLRYQRSQITGSYGKVPVIKPSLLAYCPKSKQYDFCEFGQKVLAPCGFENPLAKCRWKNISYNSLFEDTELYVPIGDLDDYPIVSIITLILGCAGCIYILSILSTASP